VTVNIVRRPSVIGACPSLWAFALVLITAATLADETPLPPAPSEGEPGVFVSGLDDTFEKTRAAVAAAKRATGRDYRVVVVDSSGSAGSADAMLNRIVEAWRSAPAGERSGFNPAADVTIVVDVGNRQIAMDVPWAVQANEGLDKKVLEGDLIPRTFVPRARDGLIDDGIADFINGAERWVHDREDARVRRAEADRVFRTRTLPLGLLGLGAAGLAGGLLVQWSRHTRTMRDARARLAAFKEEVVSLSDLLDAQQERHRMLPHADPDFKTPMEGMTRSTYDDVQASIRRYRERWLKLMEVWETAQEKIDAEWFLGTASAGEAISLLESAESRPPLADVAGACKAPLDALEESHEKARASVAAIDGEIAVTTARLEALARRGRSAAPFQAALAEVTRGRQFASAHVESDPVAAHGGLEQARSTLAATVGRIEALEAADDRRQRAYDATAEVRGRVRDRRAEGWLLTEPGANPDERLDEAATHEATAANLLDAGETEAAVGIILRAEQANADALALVESIAAARSKAEELLPACAARAEALVARRSEAEATLARLASTYAESSWTDVADNGARATDGLGHVRTLIDEARAAVAPERQHYLRAVAVLEETVRQEDWVEGCLAAITDRLAELDGLRSALPGKRSAAQERVASLERRLRQQRTDRVRANERCREAGRILEVADDGLRVSRPDLRQVWRLVEAADAAAGRGEELAAEDDRLARQAANDIEETDALVRRVASWYADGVQADVRGPASALDTARALLGRQAYEDSIRTATEAAQQARIAYATATAEADRRRVRRQQEIQRRQMEESFARMSRGAGPMVVRLPGGTFTGPDPWLSMQLPRTTPVRPSSSANASWSRDTVQATW
jgi:hypothetical protein